MNNCEPIKECIACGSTDLYLTLSLNEQPLANSFKRTKEESQEKIRRNCFGSASVEVTEEEALTFCCNSIVKDNYVFMPKCDSVAKKLLKKGFTVQQFEMSEFIKSGGACKCLVMYI